MTTTALFSALALVGAFACALWGVVALATAWLIQGLPRLEDRRTAERPSWPRLSVVLAACNEADTLEPALRTLLKSSYPDLEVVVVDDRSTDGTGAIVDKLAAEDPRVVAVHVEELPEGWLGKVHALERGTERASGEILLFTDADIHFSAGILERAVSVLEEDGLDHLTLLPNLIGGTFPLKVCIAAFAGTLLLSARLVIDRRDDLALGVGAFNLCRRAALERAGGFAPIKMEVVDDSGLAVILKRAGGRSSYLAATRSLEVEWYPTARAMMHGVEKNLFGLLGAYRLPRLLVASALVFFAASAPLLVFLPGPVPYGWILYPAALFAHTLNALASRRRFGFEVIPGLLAPLGQIAMGIMALRSAFLCLKRGGIVWRGTHYPLDALRAGQVVKV